MGKRLLFCACAIRFICLRYTFLVLALRAFLRLRYVFFCLCDTPMYTPVPPRQEKSHNSLGFIGTKTSATDQSARTEEKPATGVTDFSVVHNMLLCCSTGSQSKHHQTCCRKGCEYSAQKVEHPGAGTTGGGKFIAGIISNN